MASYSIGVAFLRGSPGAWRDTLIARSTAGPFVHTELFLQHGADSRFYTSVDVPPNTFPCAIMPTGSRLPLSAAWETVQFPVTPRGYSAAYALLLELMSLPIPYNSRDLWQCAIKVMLPLEQDLDFMRPAAWVRQGVFCSQMCLLVLRRLVAQGHILAPAGRLGPLFALNSRGCSPNDLYRLLGPGAEKKTERTPACAPLDVWRPPG
jgi:hypothetical protein